MNALDLVKVAQESSILFDDAFPLKSFVSVEADPKFVAVIGDNATGKSFVTSTLSVIGKAWHKINGYHIGMAKRAGGGMEACFVYGNEAEQSTGATTLDSVIGGFKNIKIHAVENNQKMLLILDEPTIGLSLGFEKAMGKYIASVFEELKEFENIVGLVVVSHSKAMFQEIEKAGIVPTVISTEKEKTLQEWYEEDEDNTIEELLELKEKGFKGWKEVNSYIDMMKKKNKK